MWKLKQNWFFSQHFLQSWLYLHEYQRYGVNQCIQNDLQILENFMRIISRSTNVDQMIFHHVKWKYHFSRNRQFSRNMEQVPKYVEITTTIQVGMTFEVILYFENIGRGYKAQYSCISNVEKGNPQILHFKNTQNLWILQTSL